MDGAKSSGACGCDALSTGQTLLSVRDAVALSLKGLVRIPKTEWLDLAQLNGRVLAKDILAPNDMPSFTNAAMDGFAVRISDLPQDRSLPVAGTVAAGDVPGVLPAGAALRIFTGAPVPKGANTVVMVEHCQDYGQNVRIAADPTIGQNIRLAGSDQHQGQLIIRVGTRISAHHVGLLAANGITGATVVTRPRVAIFSTGDELRSGECNPGQIHDANRPMLFQLIQQAGAKTSDLGILPDNPRATTEIFEHARDRYDLIVTSGAVSMGGCDFIRSAFRSAGGEITGWRIALKPGKPVAFGHLGRTMFTGLPGNPFAAFVGYYLFVRAQLEQLTGQRLKPFASVPARAAFDWACRPERAEAFPVRCIGYDNSGLPLLDRLGNGVSATLLPLANADGLAFVPAGASHVKPDDRLNWHPF